MGQRKKAIEPERKEWPFHPIAAHGRPLPPQGRMRRAGLPPDGFLPDVLGEGGPSAWRQVRSGCPRDGVPPVRLLTGAVGETAFSRSQRSGFAVSSGVRDGPDGLSPAFAPRRREILDIHSSSCRLLMPIRLWMLRICVSSVSGVMSSRAHILSSEIFLEMRAAITACCCVSP